MFHAPSQALASELAMCLPSKALHIRSLCNGLNSVRSSLLYVKNVLEDEDIPWHQVQDTVAIQLATSAMLLGGILDGCVIAELPPQMLSEKKPKQLHGMKFSGTPFSDIALAGIQASVNGLRSVDVPSQPVGPGLWTVVNFWKHYLPYQLPATRFTAPPLRDIKVEFQTDEVRYSSGPIVHDLLIPAFNSACDITGRLLDIYDTTGNGTHVPRIHT
jgi:hypothetical protein